MVNNILEELRAILEKTFPNSIIPTNIDALKMGDFVEWDSLGNFNLLLEIEQHYDIRFTMEEISEIKSISDIKNAIFARLKNA